MAVATKPRADAKTHTIRQLGVPRVRLTRVVDRTTKLSGDVLTSLETGERAAIEALGQFLITIEDACPQEVSSTADVAIKITESGIQMVDRLVHTEHEMLRNMVDSAAKSLKIREVAKHA